jgi:hypothetical protein
MISRRGFVVGAGAASALVSGTWAGAAPLWASASVMAVPVVSFHMDAPYLDCSGTGVPYRPSSGARGGEALEALSEAELFSLML